MGDRRNGEGRRLEDKVRATWHRFEWPAYDRGTRHLCMLEHGAYMVLLREYYCAQAPLVANVQQLMYVCRAITPTEQQAVQTVLDEFFVLEDDGFHHARCDEEIARASQLCEKRHVAGQKGGEANAKRLLKREEKIREDKNIESKALVASATRKQLPKDFHPKEHHKNLALRLSVCLEEEFEKFRDFHMAKGNVMKDWDLALNTWLRNTRQYGGKNGKRESVFERVAEELDQKDRSRLPDV